MRIGGSAFGHGAIQILAIACLIAGFGLGVQLAQYEDMVCSWSFFFSSRFSCLLLSLAFCNLWFEGVLTSKSFIPPQAEQRHTPSSALSSSDSS